MSCKEGQWTEGLCVCYCYVCSTVLSPNAVVAVLFRLPMAARAVSFAAF